MIGLSLLVTSKDTRGLREFLAANQSKLDEIQELCLLIANGRSQAEIANRFAARASNEIVGIVHSDCNFAEGDFTTLTKTAAAGKVTGLVGARLLEPHEDWTKKEVWGKMVLKETPVSTLDGCSVFFQRDIPVSFDPTFSGFHLVVEDFCLSAAEQGIPIVVPPVNANHIGQSTRKPEWQREYAKWKEKLRKKWDGKIYETT